MNQRLGASATESHSQLDRSTTQHAQRTNIMSSLMLTALLLAATSLLPGNLLVYLQLP